MKKQLKNFGGIFLLGATLSACIPDQNEDFSQLSQEKGLEVKGKTLSFADFEYYENAIQDPKEILSLDFQSIAKLTKTESASLNARILSDDEGKAIEEYEGSLILDILDEEKTVVIGERLFYLDFGKKLVAVTEDFSLRPSLIEGDYDSDLVYLFSFEDEVISLLEEGSTGTILSKKRADLENRRIAAFYVGDNCDDDKCSYNRDTPGTSGMDYRIEAKHVYQTAGIYFKLFSQAKHMKKSAAPFYSGEPTDIRIYWDVWMKSKKNSYGIRYEISDDAVWDDDLEKQYYSMGRGLEKYRLDSRFYVEVGGDHGNGAGGFSYWDFDLYRIHEGF
ncbi:MAG: hypothetical protein C0433_04195 [Cyclobacterium sp.]|nr:hypothetical protein [Cyclobacterium sp.]